MSMKIKQLVKLLEKKDQNAEVEFAVVEVNGNLVCLEMENTARAMQKLLEMFRSDG